MDIYSLPPSDAAFVARNGLLRVLSAAEWRGLPLCRWTIDQIVIALNAYGSGDFWRAASAANMLTAYVPEPAVEKIADEKACAQADILRERFRQAGITVGWLSPREFH